MLHALFEISRRAIWFATVVLALSVVTFALAPTSHHDDLPRFLNSRPKSSNTYAWKVAQDIALDGRSSTQSARELVKLGAVALPHVLPKLDSLPPDGRTRVLLALEPVAQRMGLARAQRSAAQLSSTWLSFLSDNAVYLHPQMAKRLVARFVTDPSASHARDLRRLDTFALPELVRALGTPNPLATNDVRRSVVEALRHITGHDATWSLPPKEAPVDEKYAAVVEKWTQWWFAERHLYEPPTPISQLTAPLRQTQFTLWIRGGIGAWLSRGVTNGLADVPWPALVRSVCLFTFALSGGNAFARLCDLAEPNQRVLTLARYLLKGWGSIPTALLAILAHHAHLAGMWLAAPFAALSAAALCLRRGLRDTETNRVRPSSGAPSGSMYPATLLGICLLVEWSFSIDGLGQIVLEAVRRADTTPILCVALVNTLLIGVVEYVASRRRAQAV